MYKNVSELFGEIIKLAFECDEKQYFERLELN